MGLKGYLGLKGETPNCRSWRPGVPCFLAQSVTRAQQNRVYLPPQAGCRSLRGLGAVPRRRR